MMRLIALPIVAAFLILSSCVSDGGAVLKCVAFEASCD